MLIYNQHRIAFDDYHSMERLFPKSPYFDQIILFTKAWNDPHQDEFTFRTSGSTGLPKNITHSRTSISASIEKTKTYFKLKEGDKALLGMPMGFVAGKIMLARAMVIGLDLYLATPALNPLAEYKDVCFDFIPMTPMQLEAIIKKDIDSLDRIRMILLGGAPVSQSLSKKIKDLTASVYIGYGMTETITHIAVKPLNGSDMTDEYRALDGVELALNDGCLVIQANHLEGLIVTNDIVELTDSKRFKWIGRKDLIINSGGIKINPEDMELSLTDKFGIEAAFIGIPDQHLGEKLVLIVEENQANTTFEEDDLMRFIERRYSKYHKPKSLYILKKIPRTESGKIDRQNLRKCLNDIIDAI